MSRNLKGECRRAVYQARGEYGETILDNELNSELNNEIFAEDFENGVVIEADTPIIGQAAPVLGNGNGAEARLATVQHVGIEVNGGQFAALLQAGTPLPAVATEIFSTAADGQDQIILTLFRGLMALARQNDALGRWQIIGIPPAPTGVIRVAVTLSVSQDDRALRLAARDAASGKALPIVALAPPPPAELPLLAQTPRRRRA